MGAVIHVETHSMEPLLILADNGSRRAGATLGLRMLAKRLGDELGQPVAPVSLQHADKIPADQLNGEPAQVFVDFLREQLTAGQRHFVVLPLFFGESRALTSFIPDQVDLLTEEFGEFELRIADVISPLPDGEPRLVDILRNHIDAARGQAGEGASHVIVTDHGSPIPTVTAVRRHVAEQLAQWVEHGIEIRQAVMERREGVEYDFNGRLLADELDAIAAKGDRAHVIVAMLFLLPGKHAGEGGDVASICEAAEQRNPGLRVDVTALVGTHPLLVDILRDRFLALRQA